MTAATEPAGRWSALAVLATAVLLALVPWFSAASVAPLIANDWGIGSFEVAPDQYPKLERLARIVRRMLDRNEAEMFLIEGHTDAVGSDEDNLTLSDRRAESVADILVNEFGVPVENLVTQGYGEQYLKIETEAPERQNRRVAFRRITPLLGELRDR